MTTLNRQITADADNAHCWNGVSWESAEGINIGNLAAVIDAWLRFVDVTIPKGATIVSAVITFTANVNYSADTVRVKIACNDADDAASPNSCATLAAKDRTTENVDWDFATDWVIDGEYESADFAAAVQEVVNRAGWASGNALGVIFDDDGSTENATRRSYDRDESAAKSAALEIVYTVPAAAGYGWVF